MNSPQVYDKGVEGRIGGEVLVASLSCPVQGLVLSTISLFICNKPMLGKTSTSLPISHILEGTLSSPREGKKSVVTQKALSMVLPHQLLKSCNKESQTLDLGVCHYLYCIQS